MNNVISSALLTVGMRWTDRLIGFVSTLILARLLAPEDFGVIAMASLVIGLADVLLDLGVNVALIRNASATPADYDTAWTLRMVQAILATAIVAAAAPWAAVYFTEPRLVPVMLALSASFVLSAAENIGIITFQKEMLFTRDFKFLFTRRMFGFVVTIAAAFWLQSYWALVIGSLAGRAFGAGLSYVMHPMRPRLSLEKWRDIFAVSQWLLLRNSANFLDARLHQMVVGRREGTEVMGIYALADEIAALPTTELLAPLNRVLFPAFVRVKDDLAELKRVYLLALGVQALIGVPAGVGLALVADEAVQLLLGVKWRAAASFIEVIAIANVVSAIGVSGIYVMLTLDQSRFTAIYSWMQVFVFTAGAFLLLPEGGALSIAWLRLAVAIFGIGFFYAMLKRVLKDLRSVEIVATIYRPLLAAALMSAAVIELDTLAHWGVFPLICAKIALGALAYTTGVVVLWSVAGRPPGPEAYLIKNIRAFIDRGKSRRA